MSLYRYLIYLNFIKLVIKEGYRLKIQVLLWMNEKLVGRTIAPKPSVHRLKYGQRALRVNVILAVDCDCFGGLHSGTQHFDDGMWIGKYCPLLLYALHRVFIMSVGIYS